ncbi:MAG: SDR family oxidoreductase [Dehalococcoidia bacterium]
MTTLITGASGFLGRHLLWDLLRSDASETVHCLMRTSRRGTPERRLDQLLGPVGGKLPPEARTRCHAVAGDITDPALITDPAERARLVDEVDRVIHCAATVMFDTPLTTARQINVEGTRNVLRFAADAQAAGALRRVDHISTAYVAGKSQGVAREDELIPVEFNNTYEQTKWESERLVRERWDDLPISIFRPSIIVGDSSTGYTSNFRVLYFPLRVLSTGLAIVAPLDPQGIVDLVPVDHVVATFRALTDTDESLHQCFHLAAGPKGQSTCGELLELATEFFDVRRPFLISPRISYRIVRPLLYATLWGKRRPLLRQSEQYFPYFAYRASFDTANVESGLTEAELPRLAVKDYFSTILQYALDTEWGTKRTHPTAEDSTDN